MYRYLFFYRFNKLNILEHSSLVLKSSIFTSKSHLFSSQTSNEILLSKMESDKVKLNSENPSKDLPCNTTYAQVLSKGSSSLNDVSNNNPASVTEIINGNQNISVKLDVQDGAIDDLSSANENSVIADFYVSDSSENSQISSSSRVKSNEALQNTNEDSSSLVTAENGSQPNDQNNDSQSSEYTESADESDSEEEAAVADELYPAAMKWRFRSNTQFDLPETVTVLETSHGSKVFLVGTAHFSKESQEDVAKTIGAVQPDVLMIELCKSRVNILSLDEVTILEESKNMNFQKIKATIEQYGFLQGALYLLLLNMSAHLTKQLGMAPGGEFRRAYLEAKKVPGCFVHLGDRPIHITLQRALATLSWWQKLRIAWYMLRSKDPISKEEVEKCKQKDLLEEMLAEMTGEFPELSHVFLKERDIYLTYSLQMAAISLPSPHTEKTICPSYVVGVVGIGHVPGIKENWGKITEKDIDPILRIPEPSLSSKMIRRSIKVSIIGLGIYGVYKVFPKSWMPSKPLEFISSFFSD